MDYGKLAYLKADELESRLNSTLKLSGRTVCTDYGVNPKFDFKTGDFDVSEIRADGSVTLFVRAAVRADSEITSGGINVLINGINAGKSVFSAAKGEIRELFVMCAANISGSAVVSLSAENSDCTLMNCQILISGEGAEIAGRGGDSAVDRQGDKWALVTCGDDYVYAYLFTEENFRLENPKYIGTGRRADIASGSDGFIIAYVDVAGNSFIVLTDSELNVSVSRFVSAGVERVAVSRYRGGFALAELCEGKITVRYVDGSGGIGAPEAVTASGDPKRIGFVKNAALPELIVYSDGRSYIKGCAPEHGGFDGIAVFADVALEGVD